MGNYWWVPWVEETEPGKTQATVFSSPGEEKAAQRELHMPAESLH